MKNYHLLIAPTPNETDLDREFAPHIRGSIATFDFFEDFIQKGDLIQSETKHIGYTVHHISEREHCIQLSSICRQRPLPLALLEKDPIGNNLLINFVDSSQQAIGMRSISPQEFLSHYKKDQVITLAESNYKVSLVTFVIRIIQSKHYTCRKIILQLIPVAAPSDQLFKQQWLPDFTARRMLNSLTNLQQLNKHNAIDYMPLSEIRESPQQLYSPVPDTSYSSEKPYHHYDVIKKKTICILSNEPQKILPTTQLLPPEKWQKSLPQNFLTSPQIYS